MREMYETSGLFEVAGSATEQSGTFKIESTHLETYFRGLKTYHLDGDVVRVKAVPRLESLKMVLLCLEKR
jgi:hypothetical protein